MLLQEKQVIVYGKGEYENENSIKLTTSDRFFYALNDLLLLFALDSFVSVVYKRIFQFPTAVISRKVVLFPVNVTLDGYKCLNIKA